MPFIKALIKYLGIRNVRLMSKGLSTKGKGMGQWRQGTIQNIKRKSFADPLARPTASQAMGGGRLFTPIGGGRSKFISQSSKVGYARGTKIGGGVAGAGIIGIGTYKYEKDRTPSGAATVGERQKSAVDSGARGPMRGLSAVTALKSVAKKKTPAAWHADVASFSKSGYHKFKAGSKSAKAFQQSYRLAKKTGAKTFTWGLTGKKYKVGY